MKERPILFSAPMVRAILAGDKTQTRRVVKHQPEFDADQMRGAAGLHWSFPPSQFGGPGDELWVRETWAADDMFDNTKPSEIPRGAATVFYRASAPSDDPCDTKNLRGKWRPSIFMPRWASRIQLEVNAVSVERLQDISIDDIVAEGALPADAKIGPNGMFAIDTWRDLWDSINGKRPGCAWVDNPWVWRVRFEMVNQDVQR